MAQIKYNLGDLGKEVYSTNETVIGTWIDGKTIYRRCVANNVSGSGMSVTLYVDLSNVDKIIEFHGTGILGSVELPLHYSDAGTYFDIYRSGGTLTIAIRDSGRSATLTKAFIFMDYTKINE